MNPASRVPIPILPSLVASLALQAWGGAAAQESGAAVTPRANPPLELRRLGPELVPQYGRVEWEIIGVGPTSNPYDPDKVAVRVEIRLPAGPTVSVPAFYQQPYEYARRLRSGREADWLYPAGAAGWRARFAPVAVGPHEAVAVVEARAGSARSAASRFTCETGPGRGYVRVSVRDPRFYAFTDGTVFFPIGQNLAFIGDGQYVDLARANEVFGKLAANGANFLRVWTGCEDWALAIEARRSAWGRSWDWHPPFAAVPGREGYHAEARCVVLEGGDTNVSMSPSHPVALRAATRYRLTARVLTEGSARVRFSGVDGPLGEPVASPRRTEWVRFEREFTAGVNQWWLGAMRVEREGAGRVWLRGLSLREADGGPELLWEANPDRPVRGVINEPDAWALDHVVDLAERHGIYLQLCLLTRDHYRSDLREAGSPEYRRATDAARKVLRYAVARWGWSPHVAAWEYFNEMDPGAPTADFYRELGQFLSQTDWQRRPRTTSGWGPAPADWAHPEMDSAQLHWYLRPAWGPLWQDEVAAVLDRAAVLCGQARERPALLAEFGLADDRWGLSPYLRQDASGVHIHNALWGSAFSGLAGTAMFWWWESLDQQEAYGHYRPLARFLADVPFGDGGLEPGQVRSVSGATRVLAWRNAAAAFGWIVRADATWWNRVVERAPPQRTVGERVVLSGLAAGEYRVEWWDTRTGEATASEAVRAGDSGLELAVPDFTDDLAVKVRRQR